jgi:hypothetical protein
MLLFALLAACGGSADDEGAGPIDARAVAIDAAVDATPVCGVSTPDFGSLGTRPGTATWQGSPGRPGVGLGELYIPLEADAEPDQLYISMWGGTPTLPDAIVAGTYPLTGNQLKLQTCSMCVTIGADWAPGAAAPFDHVYMATGGTVVISAIDGQPGGVFEISFSNLTFGHAEVRGTTTQLNDGCTTAISDVAFTGRFEGGKQ